MIFAETAKWKVAYLLNLRALMRKAATYILFTGILILFHTVSASGQNPGDTITDRQAVLKADIRDLAAKAYMFGILDENGRDSLISLTARPDSSDAIPELEAMRAQWEEKLSFLEKIYSDEVFGNLTSAIIDKKAAAEKMLPILLSVPEIREKFGPLTFEQAMERLNDLLGRDLAYERHVASMSKGERIAWMIARMLFGGSAQYKPNAIPMMNGLWYMPIPAGKPEQFDETLFWDGNFDSRVYKSSVPEPVIPPEERLQGH